MSEATIFRKVRNLLIPYFLIFGVTTVGFIYFFSNNFKEYAIVISLLTVIGTIYLIRAMFSATKFKGKDRTYVVGPDLSILREEDIIEEVQVDESDCNTCGKHVYKPFKCDDCKHYYCGQHYLKGEHKCNDG
ncbi:MAG: AN1-type zinc finger protein [Candidatus Hodarchaeales archaeon]|jgi:hypothetical protein